MTRRQPPYAAARSRARSRSLADFRAVCLQQKRESADVTKSSDVTKQAPLRQLWDGFTFFKIKVIALTSLFYYCIFFVIYN